MAKCYCYKRRCCDMSKFVTITLPEYVKMIESSLIVTHSIQYN